MNKPKIKIFIASDHRGVGLKLYLSQMLSAAEYDVVDLGTNNPNEPIDYPIVAERVADALSDNSDARGILICGTGAGVMIAANRFRHIRASRCDRPEQAREDRFHDDINVLCFAADDIDLEMALLTTTEFLDAPFDAAERRIRRISEIS